MTTTDLELRSGNGHVERGWIALLEPAAALASQVAGTGFVPSAMRGNPAAVVAAILYGDELGLGPMQSLAKISVIEGKPTLSAEAQRALILAAGHEIRPTEGTTTKVTMYGKRADSGAEASVTWTLDDAKRAGLAGRQNWRTYPRQMLAARATAELARLLFADVIGGLAATEEIEDVDPFATGLEVEDKSATRAGTTKRRRRTKAQAPEEKSDTPPAEGPEAGEDAGSTAPALPPLPDEPADSLLEPEPDTSMPAGDEPEPGEPRGESSAIDSGSADSSADAGGVAQDDETTASGVVSDQDTASPAQLKALDALVGRLRETEVEEADGTKSVVLSTEQLWAAAATRRNVSSDDMEALLGGRDSAGVLHWAPLRDSLTGSEASDLISKLQDRADKWGVS